MKSENTPKKLYRSQKQRIIAGVCGGIAEHLNVDPTIVRLVFVLLLFLFGSTLVIYLVMWLIVPLAPPEDPAISNKMEGS